jgi:hypothetical protein
MAFQEIVFCFEGDYRPTYDQIVGAKALQRVS